MEIPSEILDKISDIAIKKFNSLPKTGKPKPNEWTVLSCIIQEENSNFDPVALGTGIKCIGKTKMSKKGDILNDSHAEIICRRSFLRYLYEQIENCQYNKQSIFINDDEKFTLKNVRFHFFTTLMPCGDASIFPKNYENNPEECEIVDIFRTGAKCLENSETKDPKGDGIDYHITEVVRTKPGRGDPTLSVSCSDKITKWCHLGIQGTLLSLLLNEPIYLSTFIIAKNTPFCEQSLERAFFNRIRNIELIPPYKTQKLRFYQTKIDFEHQKSEDRLTCPSSIIWYKSETLRKPVEIAVDGKKQGVTKKNMNNDSSRLKICKFEIFKKFQQCSNSKFKDLNYGECKNEAVIYRKNWEILKEKLGSWPEKESDLLAFYCDGIEKNYEIECKRRKLNQ